MKIGILGGGQLGRMLALAGYPLGLHFRFFDVSPDAPAGHLAPLCAGSYDDDAALQRFARDLDAITYEWENVPVAAVEKLARHVPVYPPSAALDVAQDRGVEKEFLERLGIPLPRWALIATAADLEAAIMYVDLPAVLKTRRMGYDGKGQVVIRHGDEASKAWESLGRVSCTLESMVSFHRELSLLAVRGADGDTLCYPLVENEHRDGMLRCSLAPAPNLAPALQATAEDYARRILDALGYVGVLAVELFEVDGALLANEIAPRVHNSGHWTIEGAETSQFENHVRAICGLPLGLTAPHGHAAMVNIVGTEPSFPALLAIAGTHVHWYGKQPRPGRKLGHVTLVDADRASLAVRLAAVRRLVE